MTLFAKTVSHPIPVFFKIYKYCPSFSVLPSVSHRQFVIAMASTGDKTWAHLEDTERFGRATDQSCYIELSENDRKSVKYTECTQAAHCLLYAEDDSKIFGIYSARAVVLMQMRFDGYLGFPGGLMDPGEDPLTGLNRELVEEVGVDLATFPVVTAEDHVVTHWHPGSQLTLGFYGKKLPMSTLLQVERNSHHAHDYGNEVLGTIRVPLFTMGDGFRGFPNFLRNTFAGNARHQLLQALVQFNIMTSQEVSAALEAKPVST